MTDQDKPALMTPQEVALELRVTLNTVYEWLTSGKLRGRQFGSRWRIPREELSKPFEFMTRSEQVDDIVP
jgi:excisionase family DNA binding protein